MSLNNLLDQFLGSSQPSASASGQSGSGALGGLADKIPGGLVGGAAAGGVVALLMGNKSARKFAGKAAGYGGAALLGGLAFKAYQNWKQQPAAQTSASPQASSAGVSEQGFHQQALTGTTNQMPFELTLIRAMIASAQADGHIDADEQRRIFEAVDRMELSAEHKGFIFDCLKQQITAQDLANEITNLELKTEVYLASCLVIDIDHSAERAHLDALATALGLPADLCRELEHQAQQAYAEAA